MKKTFTIFTIEWVRIDEFDSTEALHEFQSGFESLEGAETFLENAIETEPVKLRDTNFTILPIYSRQ